MQEKLDTLMLEGGELVTVVEPEPTPPAKPTVLSKEDRLEAENLALQVQVLSLQKERFILGANKQVETFDQKLEETRRAITSFQAHLSGIYDVDFTRQQIEPGSGRIIPASN